MGLSKDQFSGGRKMPETANPSQNESILLNVHSVAKLLACSPRHARRLADTGRMPRPVKLGALVRWSRQEIEDWIAQGCPANG
jgi:excisionase family DNA binding protein